ncbi:hypothetical protein [Williamsia sterculiae]|uniref:Uncharacterized protein n=1 Tax=Williamsia sterculiae TaxID=1344003 RepID=A0A1N7GHQ0_9NOCA|nr:hypothetical protein [Williamsia sterculiae]SIS12070.1 hypothetical protein SAMN05445060_2799 [Williamsia sterculiae]
MTQDQTTGCEGKVQYPDYRMAQLYLSRKKRLKTAERRSLNIYHCDFCHQWHVGTTVRRRRARK